MTLSVSVELSSCTPVQTFMIPTVVISARGEERLRERPSVDLSRRRRATSRAAGGDRRARCAVRAAASLGHALYSDRSQIALRMLDATATSRPTTRWCGGGSRRRSRSASRSAIDATAYRLVHGEADLLPSLVVDRYGDYLVVQTLSQGMDRLLPLVVADARRARCSRAGILARNDPRVRVLEGLEQTRRGAGRRRARRRDRAPRAAIEYEVDLRRGQKTGLFLDQRENRAAAARYARGRLLDCFSYHGGFALALARPVPTRRSRSTSPRTPSRASRPTPRATASPIDARVGNVFDELRGLERLRRAVRHDRARPAGVREEQGGGRPRRAPATRKSTCAR